MLPTNLPKLCNELFMEMALKHNSQPNMLMSESAETRAGITVYEPGPFMLPSPLPVAAHLALLILHPLDKSIFTFCLILLNKNIN